MNEPWYAEWFDEEYVRVYGHRDEHQARGDTAFVIKALQAKPDDRILDLGCGNGRHLAALFDNGLHRLVGLDLSLTLLKLAADNLRREEALVLFVQADMRRLPFEGCFDIVLNLFTSFGYFETDRENQLVLQGISRSLRKGGRFVLDYLNPEQVFRCLEPVTKRRLGDRQVIERRDIESDTRRVNKEIEIRSAQGIKHYRESVRLFSHTEMLQLLTAAGLKVDRIYGDFDFQPFESRSPRMIFTGTTI